MQTFGEFGKCTGIEKRTENWLFCLCQSVPAVLPWGWAGPVGGRWVHIFTGNRFNRFVAFPYKLTMQEQEIHVWKWQFCRPGEIKKDKMCSVIYDRTRVHAFWKGWEKALQDVPGSVIECSDFAAGIFLFVIYKFCWKHQSVESSEPRFLLCCCCCPYKSFLLQQKASLKAGKAWQLAHGCCWKPPELHPHQIQARSQ